MAENFGDAALAAPLECSPFPRGAVQRTEGFFLTVEVHTRKKAFKSSTLTEFMLTKLSAQNLEP